MRREELVRYLDRYLQINEIQDYGPQGLQVEGGEEVTRIAFTVNSGEPCIDAAVKVGAQMQIVHHGLFWGGQPLIRGRDGPQGTPVVRDQFKSLRRAPGAGRAS